MMPYNTHMIEKTSFRDEKVSLQLTFDIKNLSRNNPFFFGNKIKYYTVKGCIIIIFIDFFFKLMNKIKI